MTVARLLRVNTVFIIISSPGQSPGRAIVLPPALALESVLVALAAVSALAKC